MLNKLILLLAIVYLSWTATGLLARGNRGYVKDTNQADSVHVSDSLEHAGHDHGDDAETDHKTDEVDEHAGHDHGDDADADHKTDEVDEHEGHDHGDDAETDHKTDEADEHEGHDHEEGLKVELTTDGVNLAGINVSQVTTRFITSYIELPGEIGFNEDRLVHISPRFAGIALQAHARVGDFVKKGEVVAIVESNESMNSYPIKAPISGWVIERHITPGEFVSEENSIYIVADLSTVWINLAVYTKDAGRVRKGQTATIHVIGAETETTGSIEYVTPILDFHTRNATARIILSNPNNIWRPGSFVKATISNESGKESLAVEKDAVQYLDGQSVVFVADGPNSYKPIEIVTGESDDEYVQVLRGLSEGAQYVSSGAFELKAHIVTQNMDAHAGHGH